MLFAFMVQAQKEGLRNVLIVHGKGRDDQSHANIIRSYLARWLEELPEVQAFCAALPHHGGSGACYVALRKSAQAKQETSGAARQAQSLAQKQRQLAGGFCSSGSTRSIISRAVIWPACTPTLSAA